MTLFLVYVGLCFLVAACGRRRPLRFWGYFFSSLLMTPFVGLLLLVAAARKQARDADRE